MSQICFDCGEEICEHGECFCLDNEIGCHECWRRRQDELDAELEASFQKEVIGPMLGFDDERFEDFNKAEE